MSPYEDGSSIRCRGRSIAEQLLADRDRVVWREGREAGIEEASEVIRRMYKYGDHPADLKEMLIQARSQIAELLD